MIKNNVYSAPGFPKYNLCSLMIFCSSSLSWPFSHFPFSLSATPNRTIAFRAYVNPLLSLMQFTSRIESAASWRKHNFKGLGSLPHTVHAFVWIRFNLYLSQPFFRQADFMFWITSLSHSCTKLSCGRRKVDHRSAYLLHSSKDLIRQIVPTTIVNI